MTTVKKDLILNSLKITTGLTLPNYNNIATASNVPGSIAFDKTSNIFYGNNGSSWDAFSGAGFGAFLYDTSTTPDLVRLNPAIVPLGTDVDFVFPVASTEGASIRVLFDSSNGSFRAGSIIDAGDGDEFWNSANRGARSAAFGINTLASGLQSFATGASTRAIGTGSLTTGIGTEASGHGAVATGQQTTASGLQSFAMGSQTIASGLRSVAMGTQSTAYLDNSFAFSSGSFEQTPATAQTMFINLFGTIPGNSSANLVPILSITVNTTWLLELIICAMDNTDNNETYINNYLINHGNATAIAGSATNFGTPILNGVTVGITGTSVTITVATQVAVNVRVSATCKITHVTFQP